MARHQHAQNIPDELNQKVDVKLKESVMIPSKTWLINKLLSEWEKGKIEVEYNNGL